MCFEEDENYYRMILRKKESVEVIMVKDRKGSKIMSTVEG